MLSRRRFLASTSLLAAAGMERVAVAIQRTSSLDPWIEIHAANLAHNVGEVARRAGGRPILAVIKNNAYGFGLTEAARLFEPMPPIHQRRSRRTCAHLGK